MRLKLRPQREMIGPPDCPLMFRWTFWDGGKKGHKLMVHHFLPNADDRDVHDHPRSFWTFVLWGGYDDLVPCDTCHGTGETLYGGINGEPITFTRVLRCAKCQGKGVFLGEQMTMFTLRHRKAQHAHRTQVSPTGCWTFVVMGPLKRPWGFWRLGRWWFYKDYEEEFGFAMRCEDLDKEYRPRT